MTVPVDPARAFAFAVGIERYDDDYLPDLPGAAAAAVRFGNWAAKCGIPRERIRLACSWLDPPPGELPGELVGAALHLIEDELYRTIAKAGGDRLFLYWFGHGAMYDERRMLFTSDATKANMKNIDVDELLAFLASESVAGLAQQIVLIDACANFFRVGPGLATVPEAKLAKEKPRAVVQFSAYAAGRGQKADYDRTKRTAVFSEIAFDWLDAQDALPADGKALHAHIARSYERLPAEQRSHTPVLKLHGPGIVRVFGGAVPVPGDVYDAMRDAVLTETQAQRIAERIARSDLLSTAESRSRFATALDGNDHADVGAQELAYQLMPLFAHGHGSALLETLGQTLATTEGQRLEIIGFKRENERLLELADVARVLQQTTTAQVREAFAYARPFTEQRIPRDLEDALAIAAEHTNDPRGSGPLVRFVARLEHLSAASVPDEWYRLTAGKVAELRANSRHADQDRGHLVVWFPSGAPGTVWPGYVRVSFKRAGHDWEPIAVPYEPGADGAQDAVRAAIDAVHAQGFADFAVGIVIPRRALECMPEDWACLDEFAEPARLGEVHPVILHYAERFHAPPLAQRWKQKSKAIADRLASPDVNWDAVSSDTASIAKAVEDADAVYIGLSFAVNTIGDAREDPIAQTVKGGAPYIVWLCDEPGDWNTAKDQLYNVLTTSPFEQLPMRLKTLRAQNAGGLGSLVRVIWDNPDCLPDPMRYAGMAAPRSGSG